MVEPGIGEAEVQDRHAEGIRGQQFGDAGAGASGDGVVFECHEGSVAAGQFE